MPEEAGEDVKVSTGTFAGHTEIGIKKTKSRFGGSLNANFISVEGSY